MRQINIDMSQDLKQYGTFFGGYGGEHRATKVVVTLPSRLLSNDIDHYRFVFETGIGEKVFSPNTTLSESSISISLWQQLMVGKVLKFCVEAYADDDSVIARTGAATLQVRNDIDGMDTEIDPSGVITKDELLELVNTATTAVSDAESAAERAETAAASVDPITTSKIADGAVTTAKINDGAVTGAKIASKAVTGAKIDDNTITTNNIQNGTILSEDIAAGAIRAINLANNAIETDKISVNAVTEAKLAPALATKINGKLQWAVVDALPATGDANTMYLVPEFEQLGDDEITNEAYPGGTGYSVTWHYTPGFYYTNDFDVNGMSLYNAEDHVSQTVSLVSSGYLGYYLVNLTPSLPIARTLTASAAWRLVVYRLRLQAYKFAENGTWEMIGSDGGGTAPDLSNYYTKTESDGRFVKPTDYATASAGGVVKVADAGGMTMSGGGVLYTLPATQAEIRAGTQATKPIVSQNQHIAAFYGLAKAAGDTTQAESSTFGTYTAEAKAAIAALLGIPVIVTLTQAAYDALVTKDPNTFYFIEE